MSEWIHQELFQMNARDQECRARLAVDGSMYEGYQLEMEAVHREHAARLAEIIKDIGWPDTSLVCEDGAEAAWLIAQDGIGEPGFQRF